EAEQSASTASVQKDSAPQSKAKATEGKPTATKQAARKTVVESGADAAKGGQKALSPVGPTGKKTPQSPLDRIEPSPELSEKPLKGMLQAIAKNMDQSLELPTATTVRDMPVKLMWENRAMINDHLKRTRGGKISFTHILGWAIVKAVQVHPDMNIRYEVQDGKPTAVQPE